MVMFSTGRYDDVIRDDGGEEDEAGEEDASAAEGRGQSGSSSSSSIEMRDDSLGNGNDRRSSTAASALSMSHRSTEAEKEEDSASALGSRQTPSALENGFQPSKGGAAEKSQEDPTDPNVVGWDGPEDVNNPYNWSTRHRWAIAMVVAMLGMISPLASSIVVPGITQIDAEFGNPQRVVGELTVTLYVLGLGLGPLAAAPASELVGRKTIYLTTFGAFVIFNILCAIVHNLPGLIILRFLSGCTGAAGPSLGSATIGDMFEPRDRGRVMSVYFIGPLFGPAIGPLIASFIVEATTWRYIFAFTSISSALIWLAALLTMQETYAPVLLARKCNRLKKETGNMALHPAVAVNAKTLFFHSLTRPIRLLLFSPICLFMSLYTGFVYAVLYMVFVTLPLLFSPDTTEPPLFSYEWGIGTSGLSYLGPGIGLLLAAFVSSQVQNRIYRSLSKRYGKSCPEFRVPLLFAAFWLTPIGLLIFGWTATSQTWPGGPLIGLGIFGFGMMVAFLNIQIYLVDVFAPKYFAASALAASVLVRSILGCVLPLAAGYMYRALGYGWGSTLLAGISAVMIPVPVLLWFKGAQIRELGGEVT